MDWPKSNGTKKGWQVIGIDETQFFDDQIVDTICKLDLPLNKQTKTKEEINTHIVT